MHICNAAPGGQIGSDQATADSPHNGPVRGALAAIIRFYQRFISPLTPPSCRFYPTCSEYARQAILKYGPLKGVWLGIRRISKCHPFHPGGVDPVP